jgi:ankyrin repeat protein
MTALMEAALAGRADIMRLLLDAGANARLRNRNGFTVRDYVRGKPSAAMEGLLQMQADDRSGKRRR